MGTHSMSWWSMKRLKLLLTSLERFGVYLSLILLMFTVGLELHDRSQRRQDVNQAICSVISAIPPGNARIDQARNQFQCGSYHKPPLHLDPPKSSSPQNTPQSMPVKRSTPRPTPSSISTQFRSPEESKITLEIPFNSPPSSRIFSVSPPGRSKSPSPSPSFTPTPKPTPSLPGIICGILHIPPICS